MPVVQGSNVQTQLACIAIGWSEIEVSSHPDLGNMFLSACSQQVKHGTVPSCAKVCSHAHADMSFMQHARCYVTERVLEQPEHVYQDVQTPFQ